MVLPSWLRIMHACSAAWLHSNAGETNKYAGVKIIFSETDAELCLAPPVLSMFLTITIYFTVGTYIADYYQFLFSAIC